MLKPFVDLYGGVASNYVARPHYPEQLFSWLAEQVACRDVAWDCACGSGQASHDLARFFTQVIATDASAAQIGLATANHKIVFRQAAAEASGLLDNSVDLISVGMAAHWFDLPAFYAEARRVAKPQAVLALLVYGEPTVSEGCVNEAVQRFIVAMEPYGPPERQYVKDLYKNLPFRFVHEMKLPSLHMEAHITLPEMMAYLRSRSSVIDYKAREHNDPVKALEAVLEESDVDADKKVTIRWPLAGRVAQLRK